MTDTPPQLFSTIGYVSVVLWALVPALWLVHKMKRPRGWFCHIALVLAIAALVCAKINSSSYVNLIQRDQSAELAEAREKQEAARQAALAAREGDVAEVRFAEDNANDRFDAAGMDESERKYYEKLQEDAGTPAYKREKKQRGESGPDDSLESQIGAKADSGEGMDTTTVEKESKPEPIIMDEARKELADRLDSANLTTSRLLLWLALIIVILDYLARFNRAEDSYLPLPIPPEWPRSMTPLPTVVEKPSPKRSLKDELARIVHRGDAFVCLLDEPDPSLPTTLHRLAKFGAVDVLRANDPDAPISDSFILEAIWHNRSCFVVDDTADAQQLFEQVIGFLNEHKLTRARARNPVHIVWQLATPPSEEQQRRFYRAAHKTGFSLRVL